MKSVKKFAKITLIFLLFIAIIYGIYYFFRVIYKVEGEARRIEMNLPNETQNLKYFIDECKIQKLKWKDAILIRGWVFKENVTSGNREVFLVLESKERQLVFKIDKGTIQRPDVSAVFHLPGSIQNHGFELNVPLNLLRESSYRVGFVIKDETGKYFMMTSQALSISNDAVSLKDFGSVLGLKPKSKPASIKLKAPTATIMYFIDKINIKNNFTQIYGWGYLQGMNSESVKTYILLKKNEQVIAFSVDVLVRKDVTNYYKESHLNLDSCGFLAEIATESLERGHYQVGLYIEKGNQTGMIFSDKYLDLGK